MPDGEPRRYKAGHGYVRLRWRIGTNEYVEVYEHRVIDGVVTMAEQVHHKNHQRDDNDPANLEHLTVAEHHERHPGQRKYGPYHSHDAMMKAQRAERRRTERRERAEAMAVDYRAGMSTTEIGAKYGLHCSGVSRELRAAGVVMRPKAGTKTRSTGPEERIRQLVLARDELRCQRCSASVKWGGCQVHHRLPRGLGGSSDPAINEPCNLLTLCSGCHGRVESYRTEAYAHGWLVERGRNPADVPVLRFGRTWSWLGDTWRPCPAGVS